MRFDQLKANTQQLNQTLSKPDRNQKATTESKTPRVVIPRQPSSNRTKGAAGGKEITARTGEGSAGPWPPQGLPRASSGPHRAEGCPETPPPPPPCQAACTDGALLSKAPCLTETPTDLLSAGGSPHSAYLNLFRSAKLLGPTHLPSKQSSRSIRSSLFQNNFN